MNLTARLLAQITGSATKSADLSGSPLSYPAILADVSLADGTGDNKANKIWFDSGSLIADAETALDLAGGLTDVFGDAITFSKIKAMMIRNTSTTASTIRLGGGTGGIGTNAFKAWITSTAGDGSEGILIPKGGVVLIGNPLAGYAVAAGTADILAIKEKSSLAATYEIAILGEV